MAIQRVESADQFRALTAADTLLVACFLAPWCGGCKLVDPQVEALAEELAQLVRLRVGWRDLDVRWSDLI